MDTLNEGTRKKRNKRKKRIPPPIFSSGTSPPPNNYHEDMPSTSAFPSENYVAPSAIMLSKNEMLDRFNKLFDWDVAVRRKDSQMGFVGGHVTESNDHSFVRDDELYQNSQFNMIQQRQSNLYDLRNRISRPNIRMAKIQDRDDVYREDNRGNRTRRDSSYDMELQYNRKAVSTDSLPVKSRPGCFDSNNRDRDDVYREDNRGNRTRRDSSYDMELQYNRKAVSTDSLPVKSRPGCLESNNREGRGAEERQFNPKKALSMYFVQRQPKEYVTASETPHKEQSFHPDLGLRVNCIVEGSNFNPKDSLTQNVDHCQVNEYRTHMEPLRKEQSFNPGLGLRVDYADERGLLGNRKVVINERRADLFDQDEYAPNNYYSRRTVRDVADRYDLQRSLDYGQFTDDFSEPDHQIEASERVNNYSNEIEARLSESRFRDNEPTTVDDQYPTADPFLSNGEELIIVIHKPNFEKITPHEADILRSNLIDLMVTCGNPNEMPEFINSGLRDGGRKFCIDCRTEQSFRWLIKQSLPPLNGVNLYMRRDKLCEVVKISTFAQKCTRSREDILKLIKLQNGKKGFNFDSWSMRSYNVSPKGIYFAFNIPVEDAKLLNDLGCHLSFELKYVKFTIAKRSTRTFSTVMI
ncbi:uncharacterized protein isoform X2 [Rhodnius prolixus]